MSLTSSQNVRWPLGAAVICLALGTVIGACGGRFVPHPHDHAHLLGALSETALLVCLFCVGLRLRAPLEWRLWRAPLHLVSVTLVVTIVLIAGAANVFLSLGFAQALLLGAILAPTDPVLATDVRLPSLDAQEQEDVRFVLTAEGALGSALGLPVVLFAGGFLGRYDPGPLALRWFGFDLVWAVAAGVVLGWGVGWLAARLLERLDSIGQMGLAEALLIVSTVAFAYVGALSIHASGLTAVLMAGNALGRGGRLRPSVAPARIGRWLASVTVRIEQLAELLMLLIAGVLLAVSDVRPAQFLFALLVLVAIRPLAARLGLAALGLPDRPRQAISWFGMRGLACLYYVMYALNEGLSAPLANELTAVTLAVLASSIVLHSLSAFPLVKRHVDQEAETKR
ncbi:MAG TPA: cation:proton antiporter [Steroidobacteraceae bacterium]|nr:cation:proton antiporter [Steroidobacteraceae bacterium]